MLAKVKSKCQNYKVRDKVYSGKGGAETVQRAWLKDIKGMWVATSSEGIMLGTVNNIYIDPETKKVTGLLLRAGTPLSGSDIWVTIEVVKKVGVDLIFIPKQDALTSGEAIGKKLVQLIGMPVTSKDGRALGNLVDIEVNLDTWQMLEIALSAEASVAIDPDETVLGQDLILVQSGAEADEKSGNKEKENFVESVFGKDFVKQTSDVLKRVLKGTEADLHKHSEAGESDSVSGKTADLKNDVSEKQAKEEKKDDQSAPQV